MEERRVEERRKACWIGGQVTVTGNVTAAGDLVAKDVIIAGKVKGNVLGAGKVELRKSSDVEGDITAPRFMMEEGAVLSGKVDSGQRK